MATSIIYVREIPEYHLDGLPLGRHVEHDDRSRQYAFQVPEHLVSGQLQPVRHQRFIPVLDQGNLGSCTGNAAEGVAGSGSVFQAIPPGNAVRPNPTDAAGDETQAVALYSAATLLDNIPGAYPPDDTGSTGIAAAKVMVKAGLIAGYQHTFNLADALAALQVVPLMFGINWYDSFDQPDSNGLVAITPGAQVRGGHEIVADELDVARRLVGFTNSWSASWGLGGRFYVGWGDVETLLGQQGDVTVPVPLTQQPPQPTPGPGPSPLTPDQVDQAMWSAAKTWAAAHGLS